MRAIILTLLLAGCASAHQPIPIPPPAIEVKVPVPVPCLTEIPTRPAFKSDPDLAALNDYQLVISLAVDRRERQVYEVELESVLKACAQ